LTLDRRTDDIIVPIADHTVYDRLKTTICYRRLKQVHWKPQISDYYRRKTTRLQRRLRSLQPLTSPLQTPPFRGVPLGERGGCLVIADLNASPIDPYVRRDLDIMWFRPADTWPAPCRLNTYLTSLISVQSSSERTQIYDKLMA